MEIEAGNGNASIWKMLTSALGGLCLGLLLAWFTAFSRSVDRLEMENYVQHYAPWMSEKSLVTDQIHQLQERIRQEDADARKR